MCGARPIKIGELGHQEHRHQNHQSHSRMMRLVIIIIILYNDSGGERAAVRTRVEGRANGEEMEKKGDSV